MDTLEIAATFCIIALPSLSVLAVAIKIADSAWFNRLFVDRVHDRLFPPLPRQNIDYDAPDALPAILRPQAD